MDIIDRYFQNKRFAEFVNRKAAWEESGFDVYTFRPEKITNPFYGRVWPSRVGLPVWHWAVYNMETAQTILSSTEINFEDAKSRVEEEMTLAPGRTARLAEEKGITEKDVDPKQLAMGIEVEKEHTDDPEEAKKIALDHLSECQTYYTRLKKLEKECKGKKVEAQFAELRNALMYAYRILQGIGGFGVVLNSIDYALKTLDYEEMFEAAEDVLEMITSKGGSDVHPELLEVLDRIATGIQATNMMAGPLTYAMLKKAGIWEDCPSCKGKGKIDSKDCSVCKGKGYVKLSDLKRKVSDNPLEGMQEIK
jgi:hypothetical protein